MSHKKLIAFIILINYFQIKVIDGFYDFNSVQNINNNYNESALITKRVNARTNYKLSWINFTTTTTITSNTSNHSTDSLGVPVLVVSLPPQLRHLQQAGEPTRVRLEVLGSAASIRIREASAIHQGFYSAYKVYNTYGTTGDQFVVERKDFYIYIKGLGDENDGCDENSTCVSNHCLNGRCVCNGEKPVYQSLKCHTAQPIGGKCLHSSQCQWMAGANAHCNYKGKCRCGKNGVPMHIPIYGKYCIEPKVFNDSCIYSDECQLIGTNRYCNEHFKCHCIPGYHYQMGVGCIAGSHSAGPPLHITSHVWLWLSLALVFVTTTL